MKTVLTISLLMFTAFWGVAQNKVFVPEDTISGQFNHFSVDNFGRVYVTKSDVIQQFYNKNTEEPYSTSLKTVQPTSIESSKSFRTLVFDQERSVIHFFDNTLTDMQGEIDLIQAEIQQPWAVCESFGGNTFWVLDGGVMQLSKLNQDLQIVSQTDNLTYLFGSEEPPTQMVEQNDFLYILIPGKGVAIFDIFGTYIKLYPTEAQSIGVFNDYLLLLIGNKVEAVSNKGFLLPDFEYQIPKNTTEFAFRNEKVYFLTDIGLISGMFE